VDSVPQIDAASRMCGRQLTLSTASSRPSWLAGVLLVGDSVHHGRIRSCGGLFALVSKEPYPGYLIQDLSYAKDSHPKLLAHQLIADCLADHINKHHLAGT